MIKKKFNNKSRRRKSSTKQLYLHQKDFLRNRSPRKCSRYGETGKELNRSYTDLRKIQYDSVENYQYHNTEETDYSFQYFEPGHDNWMNPWMKKKKPRTKKNIIMGSCNSSSLELDDGKDENVIEYFKNKEIDQSPAQLKESPQEEKEIESEISDIGNISVRDPESASPSLNTEDVTNIHNKSDEEESDYKTYLNFSSDNNEDEDDDEKYAPPPASTCYAVDYDHVKIVIAELSDKIEVNDDHAGTKLIEIFDAIKVTPEHLAMWALWSGGSFSNKADAKNKLQTVVDYAEKTPSAPLIKTQLRVITKLIIEKGLSRSEEYVHLILLLACHGGVCNVMKDVAINNCYGMMTECLIQIIKKQTLDEQILKELRNYRHALVEKLHLMFKFHTNQHTVNGFYNVMAPFLGLTKYIDQHMGSPGGVNADHYKKGLDQRFFATLYTKESIINRVYQLIDEKRISYQRIVQFYIDHCPKNVDKNTFLQEAIDINTGKIDKDHLCLLLEKLKIFKIKSADWKEIEKSWDDIK